jgi:TonB family protein
VVAIASILLIASLGFAVADERTEPLKEPEPMRMVFLALPGPGGGGGGGGLKMKTPPPKAMRKGVEKISSPLPAKKLPPPPEPIPKAARSAEAARREAGERADADQAGGRREQGRPDGEGPGNRTEQGPGSAGGVGSGQGTGLGPGDGNGVGDGSGGGYGGGPFRPGSGVEPPRLLREVKANYTDDARRNNIEGEVELEIVVRRDGTVGDVKVLRGLRGGLNDRAVEAVRQWRFAPGTHERRSGGCRGGSRRGVPASLSAGEL